MNNRPLTNKPVLLSVICPTERLDLGYIAEALGGGLNLQDKFDCFFFITDYQALGRVARIEVVRGMVYDTVIDLLSLGFDPDKCHFVLQSLVPEHAELQIILSTILPELGWGNDILAQSAGMLLPRAQVVLARTNQLMAVDLARKMVRRVNRLYGDIFPVPRAIMGCAIDTEKQDASARKSQLSDNVICVTDDITAVNEKVHKLFTDPKRVHADIPGTVEGNMVFKYHDAFNPDAKQVNQLKELYRRGQISDIDVKNRLAEVLNEFLMPIRQKRQQLQGDFELVTKLLVDGSKREGRLARKTIRLMRAVVGVTH